MPRRQKQHHFIYKTTCQVTGKFYVGMHSTDEVDDEYLGSGKILRYSIGKHGVENHRREILEFCPSREALKLREKEIVNEALLADPLNINLKYGGEGGWDHVDFTPFRDPQIQNEISRKGNEKIVVLWKDPEYRAANISKYRKTALAIWDRPGFKEKQSLAQTGLKRSDETKKRMSESKVGCLNNCFGTCWVTLDSVSVRIKKEVLDEYLKNGYELGRKMRS